MIDQRIVFAAQSLRAGNGGIARVDRLISELLREKVREERWRVEWHLFSDEGPVDPIMERFPVAFYGGSRVRFTLGLWRAMLRPGHFIFDAAYLAKIHRPWFLGLRRPFMVFVHSYEVWENASVASIRACHQADFLACNSNNTRARAERCHGGFTRARVCWLGTEPDAREVNAVDTKIGGSPVVLVVGRMVARENYKGHRELIETWPEVLRAIPNATLEFIGHGDLLPEFRRLADQLGIAARVVFRGFVSEAELDEAYRRAMAFALPSRAEGFGLVYVEAMRHGLPVLASVHDAGAEVVGNGETGLLADLDKPGDLAAKLIQLLSDPLASRKMGLAGQRRWREQFTYPAFRRRFDGILRDFLKDHADRVES